MTPDNIVVNPETLRVTFVDLDSVLIVDSSLIASNHIKKHQRIKCEQCFAFVPEELCQTHLSDINIVSVLQVFLEDSAGVTKGFLHSIPDDLDQKYSLTNLMKQTMNCDKLVHCLNRFIWANKVHTIFMAILATEKRIFENDNHHL